MRFLWVLGVLLVSGSMPGQANAEEWFLHPREFLEIRNDSVGLELDTVAEIDGDSGWCSVEVNAIVPHIKTGPTKAIVDSLNEFLYDLAMEKFGLAPGKSIEDRVEAEIDSIVAYWKEWGGNMFGGSNWKLAIDYLDHSVLSLKLFEDVCWHCNGFPYKETFFHFALPSLKELSKDSLFLAGKETYLDSICTIAFRRDQKIPDDTSLWEAGYSFRGTNSNFYITDSGIVYVFNAYEINSGAYGMSTAYLSWEQLKPVIRPDGPLGWVLKEE